jgi:peptide/nickel transport system ATP-binding protein
LASAIPLPVASTVPGPLPSPPPTDAGPVAPAASRAPEGPAEAVLEVNNLRTYFFTYDGVVKALDGVTFRIRKGETLGLVGETGCGKSVTAFSITRLIADPPGRIMDGTIRFKGANLLFGVHDEATFHPIKKTNRVKVVRRGRRIRAALERMTAVRGAGISMIFQEPMTALNPIFTVADQISEALQLHRGGEIIERLLSARPDDPAVAPAIERAIQVAGTGDFDALRAATTEIGNAARLPSLGTQIYYILRGANPTSAAHRRHAIHKAVARARLTNLQRNYLRGERSRLELRDSIKQVYLEEMRDARVYGRRRRSLQGRLTRLRLQGGYFGLPVLKGRMTYPLKEERFWLTVQLLEGVSIANPDRVARGYPHELSGGMIQRVMIAMALSAEPELLIADEPTTALDVTIQAQILDLMRELKHRVGTSILLITHDLGVIAEVADRVCVMYAGNVVEVGPVRAIFTRPLHPYTQGLLNSIPRLDDPGRHLESIPGSVPNLITPPSGCRFRTRCPHAMPVCAETRPPMTHEGEEHRVACYLYHGRAATLEDL